MENAFRNALCGAVSLVVGIRVQSVVRDDVVFEKGLQVLLAPLAEQECVDFRTELLEGEI